MISLFPCNKKEEFDNNFCYHCFLHSNELKIEGDDYAAIAFCAETKKKGDNVGAVTFHVATKKENKACWSEEGDGRVEVTFFAATRPK